MTLTVSSGRPTVPAIPAGTPRDNAEELIRAAGFDPDVDRNDAEYSDTADEGTVIRTEPAAGTELARGSSVRLVLSRGSEAEQNQQVEVPNVIGDDFDDARDELRELGLKVDRAHQLGDRFGDRFGNGFGDRVLQQSHGPGSKVDQGTTITLTTF